MESPEPVVVGKMEETQTKPHPLSCKWTLWSHLPHDTDWTLKSYKKIVDIESVEDMISLMEDVLSPMLVQNCMFFIMKEGIKPMWEDDKNRDGGCFSYKIASNTAYDVWKDVGYHVVGNCISNNMSFVSSINGFTISPKKNFCIFKIWMKDSTHQNPAIIKSSVKGLSPTGCIFKKHF
jgi:hypothetical protein